MNAKNTDKVKVKDEEIDVRSLGVTITSEGGGIGDMKNRISKARYAFIKTRNIWMEQQ